MPLPVIIKRVSLAMLIGIVLAGIMTELAYRTLEAREP